MLVQTEHIAVPVMNLNTCWDTWTEILSWIENKKQGKTYKKEALTHE